jgi:hypothetical protein
MKLAGHLLLRAGIAFGFAMMSSAVHGQTGTTQGTRGRTDPVQRELQRRFESEAIEQLLAEGSRRRDEHGRRRILAQIKEDFLRLQIVDDEVQKYASVDSPDLEAISKFAAEIAKLAERLKINLALPNNESTSEFSESKSEEGIEQLRRSLAVLRQSINSFVENPVFERAGVVDAQLSLKARRDLEQIIEVSKQVKKRSETLMRSKSLL